MIDTDRFKAKGYDDKRNQLGKVKFLIRLEKNGRILPLINNNYIVVTNVGANGSYVFDSKFNELGRIRQINGVPVAPNIIYNNFIFFQDIKSWDLVKYNLNEEKAYPITGNIITGLSFNINNYFLSGGGLGEQQLCYDLENDRIVWEQKLTEKLSQHVSDGEVLITEAMDWSFKIGRELKTGKELWRIETADYSELKATESLGRTYLVDNLIVGHTNAPKAKVLMGPPYGTWKWFGIDKDTLKMNWITEITHSSLQARCADRCLHTIYKNLTTGEYHYLRLNMLNGEILDDYSIHDQLLAIQKNDHVKECRKELMLGAIVYSDDYMYFGVGTFLVALNKNTKKINVLHQGESQYYQGRIAHNKLFMTMYDMSVYIFEGID